MNIVLLGIALGMLTLIPPGPVSLTLIQIGARRGHQPAMRGALGVASGDLVLGGASVAIVAAGATLPTSVFSVGQIVAAGLLMVVGIVVLWKPDVAAASIDRVERPGRALFLLTSLTPTALGAWVALLAAMPFAGDVSQLGLFAVGVVVASLFWHPVLAVLASTVGARLTPQGQNRLSRAGGVTMGAVGAILVGAQMA